MAFDPVGAFRNFFSALARAHGASYERSQEIAEEAFCYYGIWIVEVSSSDQIIAFIKERAEPRQDEEKDEQGRGASGESTLGSGHPGVQDTTQDEGARKEGGGRGSAFDFSSAFAPAPTVIRESSSEVSGRGKRAEGTSPRVGRIARLLVSVPWDSSCGPFRDWEEVWAHLVVPHLPSDRDSKVEIIHFDELGHHHVDLDPPLRYYRPEELGVDHLRSEIQRIEEDLVGHEEAKWFERAHARLVWLRNELSRRGIAS